MVIRYFDIKRSECFLYGKVSKNNERSFNYEKQKH